MVKKRIITKISIILLGLMAMYSIFAIFSNKKQNQVVALTQSQLEQRRANPGLYQTDSMDFVVDNGITLTWENLISNNYISTEYLENKNKLTVMNQSALKGDLVCGNVENLYSINYAFSSCSGLTSIDLTNLDTSLCDSMQQMFSNCTQLKSIIFGDNFNTSQVTIFTRMFENCSSLTELDVSNFSFDGIYKDVSNTPLVKMFFGCKSLTKINLSSFNFSKLKEKNYTYYDQFLSGCYPDEIVTPQDTAEERFDFLGLECIIYKDKTTGKIYDNMATIMPAGTTLIAESGGLYKTGTSTFVKSWAELLRSNTISFVYDCQMNVSIGIPAGDLVCKTPLPIKSMSFAGCKNLTSIDTSSLDITLSSFDSMFSGCTNLKTLNLGTVKGPTVHQFNGTFKNCVNLKNINIGDTFTFGTIYSIDEMFAGCTSLESIDLTCFSTADFRSMRKTFQDCKNLKTINLPNVSVKELMFLNETFSGCTSLESIDLSSYTLKAIENMNNMFYGCTSLKNVKFATGKTVSYIQASNMFQNCSQLESVDLSGMDFSYFNGSINMFAGCSSLSTIKTPSNIQITFNNFSLTRTYYKNQETGEKYTDLTAVVPSSATLVYYNPNASVDPTPVGPTSLADRVNYAGVYKADTTTMIKSWNEVKSTFISGNSMSILNYENAEKLDVFVGEELVNKIIIKNSNIKYIDFTNATFENFESFEISNCQNFTTMNFADNVEVKCSKYITINNCSNLTKLDLSAFDLSQANNDSNSVMTLSSNENLTEIKLPSKLSSNVTLTNIGLTDNTYKSRTDDSIISSNDNLKAGDVIYLDNSTPNNPDNSGNQDETNDKKLSKVLAIVIVSSVLILAIIWAIPKNKRHKKRR